MLFQLFCPKYLLENVKGIGFAMPGPFDYVKGICYIRVLQNMKIFMDSILLMQYSSSLDVPEDFLIRFMNDASSFAVGEAWAGSCSKSRTVHCQLLLVQDFGSAFISNRIPIVDGSDVPKLGCVYHLPYKDGIADDYFSTRGLLGRYKKLTGKELSGVKELAALAASDKIVS